MSKRRTTEEFIELSKKAHGDRYDYSKVVYKQSHTHVSIICPVHGQFEQMPVSHIKGSRCQRCSTSITSGKRIPTTEEFVKKAKKIHGDRYDYSKVVYVLSNIPVIVICKKHGEFKPYPNSHLRGSNCRKCAERLTQEEFVERARKAHGDRYDYSKTKYTICAKDVTVSCKEHGEFTQLAANHIYGHGCPRCASGGRGFPPTLPEEFIKKVKKIHGDRYDYSKANYINTRTNVTVICKEHGEFQQLARTHSAGSGCPKCANKARGRS